MSKKIMPGTSREPGSTGLALILFSVGLVAFLVIPVAFIVFYSFSKAAYFVFPPQRVYH